MSSFASVWNNFTSTGDSFPDLMHDLEAHFTNLMHETAKVPKDVSEHFAAFVAAVNWKEPLIICIITCHIILFTAVLLLRNYYWVQIFLFLIICCLIACSEIINSLCSENWRLISSQNYFDSHGAFAGTFFAGPLLIIGFTQLINFLVQSSSLLIKVKRMELARNKKAKESDAANAAKPDVGSSNDIRSSEANGDTKVRKRK